MKIILIAMFLSTSVFNSCAQSNCNIKKAQAFYTVTMPGMAMADENGNTIPPKPNIARFIYIEWSGVSNPQIATILYNNKALVASLNKVAGSSIIPGSDVGNNKHYTIKAKRGNSLWKIELQPAGTNLMPVEGCKNIIIKTKGKACTFKLMKEIQLETLPSY